MKTIAKSLEGIGQAKAETITVGRPVAASRENGARVVPDGARCGGGRARCLSIASCPAHRRSSLVSSACCFIMRAAYSARSAPTRRVCVCVCVGVRSCYIKLSHGVMSLLTPPATSLTAPTLNPSYSSIQSPTHQPSLPTISPAA